MRPTKKTALPSVSGDDRASRPSSPLKIEPPKRQAKPPARPATPVKGDEVSGPSPWRLRLQKLWQALTAPLKFDNAPPPEPPKVPEGEVPPEFRAKMLRIGVVSTVGNYREHNEDNFYLPTLAGKAMGGGVGHRDASMDITVERGPSYSFVVADGMGGQLAGEKASQMAVDIIPKELSKRIGSTESDDKQIQKVIKDAVATANQEILGLSVIQPEMNNMGTTVVLALFRNDRVYVAGIGDSRAYRFRDGRIEQLTKDHSLAQALLEAGTITAEELPNHKFNHVLYLYLGSKDARGGPEDVKAAEVRAGDRFLLASDGLTGVVHDAQLAEVVAASDDPQTSARALIKMALDNQSKDNVTCLVIHAV
jgi:serine/threonine protein phosphatase PrpC